MLHDDLYDGSQMLPHPAVGRRAVVRTDWDSGRVEYSLLSVGTFTLMPVLDCPEGWSDPHGRTLPCNHVRLYMGTGGPHTRQENRKHTPAVHGYGLTGPLTTDTRPEPGGIEAGSRSAYLAWQSLPSATREEAARIVKAVAAHWGARPDLDRIKAAYARTQAPRLERQARKHAERARARFEAAARELAGALADAHHQQRLTDTRSAAQAAPLISPDAPATAEYTVHGERERLTGEYAVNAVTDATGRVVHTPGRGWVWQSLETVVTAAGPEDAAQVAAAMFPSFDEREHDESGEENEE